VEGYNASNSDNNFESKFNHKKVRSGVSIRKNSDQASIELMIATRKLSNSSSERAIEDIEEKG
jgi:uncharacterized alkaline shock family protein YloU